NHQLFFRTTNNEQRTTNCHQPSTINNQLFFPNNEQRTTNNAYHPSTINYFTIFGKVLKFECND
ncbi:MAG TPA: hypothetical protein DDY04_02570, partial [Bacteroidales bacterium]|nr:hypothetical protein [Bacteroidales bacterium]